MKCDRCQEAIEKGEEREMHGQNLCEDCYIDALSPAKACDPWAVYSAKSFAGDTGAPAAMTDTQSLIMGLLREARGATEDLILQTLHLKPSDLERELATLRHLDRIRAELREGRKVFFAK